MVKDKKILITGGLGFIGLNAALHFSKNNRVCVLDDCSRMGVERNIDRLNKSRVEFHNVDISHFKDLRNVFYAFEPDIVIHLAAQTSLRHSIKHPSRDFDSNLRGSFHLLELARTSHERPVMIYASTSLSFETPLDCSKASAGQYFINYARNFDLPAVVFRLPAIYGPHQYGTESEEWIARLAVSLVLSKPVTISGDRTRARDVLYVDDVMELYEKAIDKIDSAKGDVFDIGGGPSNALSVEEVVKLLGDKTSGELQVSFEDKSGDDIGVYTADLAKAKKLLDWEPSTGIESGMKNTLNWIREERDHLSSLHDKQGATDTHYLVSVVIPAKNEEESLPSTLDELGLMIQAAPYRIEVIVVNDRSKDRTADVAGQYDFVKVVDNKYRSGKGGALRSGFDAAKGAYMAMMDADYSHDAFDLPSLVEEAKRHKGMVVASRLTGGSEEYTMVRAFGNLLLTWFFGFLHGRYLSDVLNGYKVFHRDIYDKFQYISDDFEIEIELVVNALRLKRTVSELPSRERLRLKGKSKLSVVRHGGRFFWRIFTEYFRKSAIKGN